MSDMLVGKQLTRLERVKNNMLSTRVYMTAFTNHLYDLEGYIGDDDEPWVGYDLDGTLALYDGWKGATSIGGDIYQLTELLCSDLKAGKRVKIFTARMSVCTGINASIGKSYIQSWAWIKFGVRLEVTNIKDIYCYKIYDDLAVNVEHNTGIINE